MRKCQKCGFEVENDEAKFCKRCGAPLQSIKESANNVSNSNHNLFLHRLWYTIIIGGFFILIVFIFLQWRNNALLFNTANSNNNSNKESTEVGIIRIDSITKNKFAQNLVKEKPIKPSEEVQVRPPQEHVMSNVEKLAEAKKNKNWRVIDSLANKKYVPAYIILAEHYLRNPSTHDLAYKYAILAKQANVKEANEILKILELYDY